MRPTWEYGLRVGRLCASVAVLLILSACTVRAPIEGQFENGEPISGVATATMEKGTVEVRSEKTGLVCEGSYNPVSQAKEWTVPLECNDGRTGTAQVHRSDDLTSGNGTFRLSDGRTGQFKFELEK